MTKINLTQEQKNLLVFNATRGKSAIVTDAQDLLDWILDTFTEFDDLAEQLRWGGFVSDYHAIKISKGQWLDFEGMSQTKFDSYSKPSRFSK